MTAKIKALGVAACLFFLAMNTGIVHSQTALGDSITAGFNGAMATAANWMAQAEADYEAGDYSAAQFDIGQANAALDTAATYADIGTDANLSGFTVDQMDAMSNAVLTDTQAVDAFQTEVSAAATDAAGNMGNE